MNCKLTIICFAYNHEQYLDRTLNAFVNQKTQFKFRVVVHDDASTDNTQEIIRQYAERYPEIIIPVLQKENIYSKGLHPIDFVRPYIEGEYIAVCEGDDYWTSDSKLQQQVNFLDENPDYSACVHNSIFLNVHTGTTRNFNLSYHDDCDIGFEQLVSGVNGIFHTSSLVYRREYFDKRPKFVTEIHEFGDYTMALFLAISGKIRYFTNVWSVYRYMSGVDSWSAKQEGRFSNIKAKSKNINAEIKVLQLAKEYAPQYSAVLDKEKDNKLFKLYVVQGKFISILRDKKLRLCYHNQTFKRKLRIFLRSIVLIFMPKS